MSSPIEQFEIFFLSYPFLENTQIWLSSEVFSLYDYEDNGIFFWFGVQEIGHLSGNLFWLWLVSSVFLVFLSEFEDALGASLVYYWPFFMLPFVFTSEAYVSYAIFALAQDCFFYFTPSQVQRRANFWYVDDGGLSTAHRFYWWNFDVFRLFPYGVVMLPVVTVLSWTNALGFLTLVVFLLGSFLFFWMEKNAFFASLYRHYVLTLLGVLQDQDIDAKNHRYGLLLLPIFLLILVSNLIGLVPYNYTLTSHICFTFTISMSFFVGINLVGLMQNRENLLLLFLPGSAPPAISVFLIFIETLSYLARMLSLSIRLFANIVAGHILLKILSNFLLGGLLLGGYINVAIVLVIQGFFFLETGVACLQAYIFFILCVIYLKDVVSDTTHH